jgi:hypothetical protein
MAADFNHKLQNRLGKFGGKYLVNNDMQRGVLEIIRQINEEKRAEDAFIMSNIKADST